MAETVHKGASSVTKCEAFSHITISQFVYHFSQKGFTEALKSLSKEPNTTRIGVSSPFVFAEKSSLLHIFMYPIFTSGAELSQTSRKKYPFVHEAHLLNCKIPELPLFGTRAIKALTRSEFWTNSVNEGDKQNR